MSSTAVPTWLAERGSTVWIETRATGALKAFAHDRTFTAPVGAWKLSADPDAAALDIPLTLSIASQGFEPERQDLSEVDYRLMMRNLRGRNVLDCKRYPDVLFSGHYAGTWQDGRLRGELTVRKHRFAVDCTVDVRADRQRAEVSGGFETTLSALGIKPFSVLMGALRLDDWARIGFQLTLNVGASS